MKRLAVVLAFGLSALAAGATLRFRYEDQALTRAAPTLGSEGMSLDSVAGYRVTVCANVGQTLSGGGNLRARLYHPDADLWIRNSALDLAVTETTRCQAFTDVQTAAPIGSNHRVHYATDAVTVSGGTTVTVRIDGATR